MSHVNSADDNVHHSLQHRKAFRSDDGTDVEVWDVYEEPRGRNPFLYGIVVGKSDPVVFDIRLLPHWQSLVRLSRVPAPEEGEDMAFALAIRYQFSHMALVHALIEANPALRSRLSAPGAQDGGGRQGMTRPAKELQSRPAGPDHQVVTLKHGRDSYRRKPCSDCPWRKDAVGEFPAEAFRLSAHTAYDMSNASFSCHQSGKKKPATCAGFLLRGSAHNLSVRLKLMRGLYKLDVEDGGADLHGSYRDMAIANGVDPDDPILAPCR